MTMDESAITAQNSETTEPAKDGEILPGLSVDKEFTALYKHFGVEPSPRTDEALAEIWQYAKEQAPSKDRDSIILQVIKFNNELGSPGLGDSPYSKMYNYLVVYKQFKKAGKLLDDLKSK
jgi:hypothetical protein